MTIRKKQSGIFLVELALSLAFVVLFLDFTIYLNSYLFYKHKAVMMSNSAVTLIKERDFHEKLYSSSNLGVNAMMKIIDQSVERQNISRQNFSNTLQVEKVTFNGKSYSYQSKSIKGCRNEKKLKNLVESETLFLEQGMSLYRVTLCSDLKSNMIAATLIGSEFQSYSTMLER